MGRATHVERGVGKSSAGPFVTSRQADSCDTPRARSFWWASSRTNASAQPAALSTVTQSVPNHHSCERLYEPSVRLPASVRSCRSIQG